MHRAVQTLVSTRPVLFNLPRAGLRRKHALLDISDSVSMTIMYSPAPYICTDCRRYLLDRRKTDVKEHGVRRGRKPFSARQMHSLATKTQEEESLEGDSRLDPTAQSKPPRILKTSAKKGTRAWQRKLRLTWSGNKEFKRLDSVSPPLIPPNVAAANKLSTDEPPPLVVRKALNGGQMPTLASNSSIDEGATTYQDITEFDFSSGHQFRSEISSWRVLLEVHENRDGDRGIEGVWEAMRRCNVRIPTKGADGDALWRIFLGSAKENISFLNRVFDYAKNLDFESNGKQRWPHLYGTIIAGCVSRGSWKETRYWHLQLCSRFPPPSWGKLFIILMKDYPRRQNLLRKLFTIVPQPTELYDTIISNLCDRGLFTDAWRWHRCLIAAGDRPTDSSSANALITYTAHQPSLQNTFLLLQSFLVAGVPLVESSAISIVSSRLGKRITQGTPRKEPEVENQDHLLMRLLLGTWQLPPESRLELPKTMMRKVLGDEFWAKLFKNSQLRPAAILALIPRFADGFLAGPLTIDTISTTFRMPTDEAICFLRNAGLAIQDGHITLPATAPELPTITTSVASTGTFVLPYSVYNSAHYHLILEFLSTCTKTITPSSIRQLDPLLAPRRRGRRPATALPDELNVLIDLLRALHSSDYYYVHGSCWLEILKRLGKQERLEQLEELVLSLAPTYLKGSALNERKEEQHIKEFLPANQLRAFIECGFLVGGSRRWLWGVKLVKRLQKLGVPVNEISVVKAIRVRLRAVFGEYNFISWGGRRNSRKKSFKSIEHVVLKCERVWGGQLFARNAKGDLNNETVLGTGLKAATIRRWLEQDRKRRRRLARRTEW